MTTALNIFRLELGLDMEPGDRDWRDHAACLEVDPESMQPEVATPEDVELAKRVCIGCPVRLDCRALADSQAEAYGIHDGRWYGEAPKLPERQCEHCGNSFPVQRNSATYCGARCRQAARRAKLRSVPA
jgi:hypothetical protein